MMVVDVDVVYNGTIQRLQGNFSFTRPGSNFGGRYELWGPGELGTLVCPLTREREPDAILEV